MSNPTDIPLLCSHLLDIKELEKTQFVKYCTGSETEKATTIAYELKRAFEYCDENFNPNNPKFIQHFPHRTESSPIILPNEVKVFLLNTVLCVLSILKNVSEIYDTSNEIIRNFWINFVLTYSSDISNLCKRSIGSRLAQVQLPCNVYPLLFVDLERQLTDPQKNKLENFGSMSLISLYTKLVHTQNDEIKVCGTSLANLFNLCFFPVPTDSTDSMGLYKPIEYIILIYFYLMFSYRNWIWKPTVVRQFIDNIYKIANRVITRPNADQWFCQEKLREFIMDISTITDLPISYDSILSDTSINEIYKLYVVHSHRKQGVIRDSDTAYANFCKLVDSITDHLLPVVEITNIVRIIKQEIEVETDSLYIQYFVSKMISIMDRFSSASSENNNIFLICIVQFYCIFFMVFDIESQIIIKSYIMLISVLDPSHSMSPSESSNQLRSYLLLFSRRFNELWMSTYQDNIVRKLNPAIRDTEPFLQSLGILDLYPLFCQPTLMVTQTSSVDVRGLVQKSDSSKSNPFKYNHNILVLTYILSLLYLGNRTDCKRLVYEHIHIYTAYFYRAFRMISQITQIRDSILQILFKLIIFKLFTVIYGSNNQQNFILIFTILCKQYRSNIKLPALLSDESREALVTSTINNHGVSINTYINYCYKIIFGSLNQNTFLRNLNDEFKLRCILGFLQLRYLLYIPFLSLYTLYHNTQLTSSIVQLGSNPIDIDVYVPFPFTPNEQNYLCINRDPDLTNFQSLYTIGNPIPLILNYLLTVIYGSLTQNPFIMRNPSTELIYLILNLSYLLLYMMRKRNFLDESVLNSIQPTIETYRHDRDQRYEGFYRILMSISDHLYGYIQMICLPRIDPREYLKMLLDSFFYYREECFSLDRCICCLWILCILHIRSFDLLSEPIKGQITSLMSSENLRHILVSKTTQPFYETEMCKHYDILSFFIYSYFDNKCGWVVPNEAICPFLEKLGMIYFRENPQKDCTKIPNFSIKRSFNHLKTYFEVGINSFRGSMYKINRREKSSIEANSKYKVFLATLPESQTDFRKKYFNDVPQEDGLFRCSMQIDVIVWFAECIEIELPSFKKTDKTPRSFPTDDRSVEELLDSLGLGQSSKPPSKAKKKKSSTPSEPSTSQAPPIPSQNSQTLVKPPTPQPPSTPSQTLVKPPTSQTPSQTPTPPPSFPKIECIHALIAKSYPHKEKSSRRRKELEKNWFYDYKIIDDQHFAKFLESICSEEKFKQFHEMFIDEMSLDKKVEIHPALLIFLRIILGIIFYIISYINYQLYSKKIPLLLVHKGSSHFYLKMLRRQDSTDNLQSLSQQQQVTQPVTQPVTQQVTQQQFVIPSMESGSSIKMNDLDYYLWIDETLVDSLKQSSEFLKNLQTLQDHFCKNLFHFVCDSISTMSKTLPIQDLILHVIQLKLGRIDPNIIPNIRIFSNFSLDRYNKEISNSILGSYGTSDLILTEEDPAIFKQSERLDRLLLSAFNKPTRILSLLDVKDIRNYLYRFSYENFLKTSTDDSEYSMYQRQISQFLVEIDVGYLRTIPFTSIESLQRLSHSFSYTDQGHITHSFELLFPTLSSKNVIEEKLKYILIYIQLLHSERRLQDQDRITLRNYVNKSLKFILNYYRIACLRQSRDLDPLSFMRWLFKYKRHISSYSIPEFNMQRQEDRHFLNSLDERQMIGILDPFVGELFASL